MHNLTIWDLVLAPIYLILLISLAIGYCNKHYPKRHKLRKYYLNGLFVKLGGAIFIALIYEYYYGGGGDTYNYFNHCKIINSSLDDSIETWFNLLLHTSPDVTPRIYPYVSQMMWYDDPSSYTVARIGAVCGLLNGTTYIPIALLFAYISYTGIWAMYRTFISIYPKLYKQLAIAFLFIPSTFVWGSALFKDTICMFGLGWLVYTTFRIFVNRDLSLKNIVMLVLSFYLIASIKLYILLAFLPALSLWLLLTYSHKIKTAGLRWLVTLAFVGVTIGGFFFFSRKFADELNQYSLEQIAQTANTTRSWIGYVSDYEGGSGYDLGAFDPSIGGMLLKFPQAVVVTLFRPFLWEARKVIVMLSALEALVFLYFTLQVFFTKTGRTIKWIRQDPTVMFCLTFALIFAFAVGISSYNFGALSRYKIPCMPFYAAFLVIAINKQKSIEFIKPKLKKRALPQPAI